MSSRASRLDLDPDEFAFRFETVRGVDVDRLAVFMQRTATVARRAGTELEVVGVPEGSLVVKMRVVAKAAGKEFKKTPIAASASVAAVGAVVAAIVQAMVPGHGNVTPVAKAGAELVEQHQVQTIEVITINQTFIVMDENRAAQVRMLQMHRKAGRLVGAEVNAATDAARATVPKLVREAQQGTLGGEIFAVDGELHFRPERFRYLVPIDPQSAAFPQLRPGQHVRAAGTIVTLAGLPERIIIESVAPR